MTNDNKQQENGMGKAAPKLSNVEDENLAAKTWLEHHAGAANVWQKLSRIDVSEHVQTKMNLSYLSWAWAWGTLMENYPSSSYEFTRFDGLDVMTYPDGSCSVECNLTVSDTTRTMWLPVMDHRNNAISNPSARQISDTKVRALVKTIAMFGLGHYIYAGEDLPPDHSPVLDDDTKAKASKEVDTVEELEAYDAANKDEPKAKPSESSVRTALTVFIEDSDSVGSLTDLFKKNKSVLDTLKQTDPKEHALLIKSFNNKKSELKA